MLGNRIQQWRTKKTNMKEWKDENYLRWDCDLCVSILFDFLQVASLFSNEAADEIVMSQNFERNFFSAVRERCVYSVIKHTRLTLVWQTENHNIEYVFTLTHIFVSIASFCMISMMFRQAELQPSGVEWTVIGFSAAPAFSLRWMSILSAHTR